MTQLEVALFGGFVAVVSALMTRLIYGWLSRSAFITKSDFRLYEERWRHYEDRLEELEKDIHRIARMLERFIIHSDLDPQIKTKIINGG